jgi:hypothetical protein
MRLGPLSSTGMVSSRKRRKAPLAVAGDDPRREASKEAMFDLREQPGVRIGVVISDDRTMVYAPVSRNVEAGRPPMKNRTRSRWMERPPRIWLLRPAPPKGRPKLA